MSYFTTYFTGYFRAGGAVTPPVVTEERPSGGWGAFRGWGKTRKDREYDEILRQIAEEDALAAEIAALEAHIADERNVKREVVRIESKLRDMPYLPRPARKAVRRALRLQTHIAFDHAETILRRLQEEEEELAVLMSLALH